MPVRRLLRGTVPREDLEGVFAEFARRYDLGTVRVEFLEADDWLSVPCVVNGRWFLKVVSGTHSLVHAVLTTGRNLGAFSAGATGFFEQLWTPHELAAHELAATRRMREIGVAVPEPLGAFEHADHGVVVLEYLDGVRPLPALDRGAAERVDPRVFGSLARMHAAGLVHGDLRGENVLVMDGVPHFIDATSVDPGVVADARAYDLACALGSLTPHVGARTAVGAALAHYDPATLRRAEAFLRFATLRPDLAFDGCAVRGEIERATAVE
jgi:tRNA A-37 threonylcarbamoyl transferase component Bud32